MQVESRNAAHRLAAATSRDALAGVAATGAAPQQWERILTRAADSDVLASELAAATSLDTIHTRARTARQTSIQHQLDTVLAEHTRRQGLDPETRSAEDLVRRDSSRTTTPAAPTTRVRRPQQRRNGATTSGASKSQQIHPHVATAGRCEKR